MLKLIPKYQRGNIVPVRATPTLKKKSWESEEDYQDRIARQSKENIDSIKQEQLKAEQLNKKNLEEYMNSKEGQLRMKKIQNEVSQLFSNIKVTPNTNNSLQRKANLIQNAMQADINAFQSIKVKQAIRNQIQKKLDKWKDYKNGLDATLTAIELGLSGGSILGAYSNWRKWETAASATKRAVANFLQKAQLPMQVGGTLIDGYQTYDAIKNNNTFETAWNATSGALGVAGTLGASDVTRFHNPKIDLVLDMLGLTGNVGDFIKFGISTYNDKNKQPLYNYNTWSKWLSQAWNNQDLSKDHYDYRKYYNDQPIVAWLQLNSILAHKWNKHIPTGHFPDKGASGTYKTKTHPTYPDLGDKSWSKDNKIYYLSKDQYIKPNDGKPLDDTMDYLGSDYDYNNGGTKIVYDGANVLPTLYVTKTRGNGFNLKLNKNNNGYIYFDRKD